MSAVVYLPRPPRFRHMGGPVVLDLPGSPHAESRNGCQWVGSVLVGKFWWTGW